jgi:hypothetical protein
VTRHAFLDSVRREVERLTGLSLDNNIQKRGYTSSLPTFLFQDTFEMLKRNVLANARLVVSKSASGELTLLLAEQHVLAAGSEEDIQRVERVWGYFVRRIEKDNPALFKAAVALIDQEARFWSTRERLERWINEFTAIPLYSTRCKYVKRAEGPAREE